MPARLSALRWHPGERCGVATVAANSQDRCDLRSTLGKVNERTANSVARVVKSPLFPFDSDLRVKPLGSLLPTEIEREGEGDRPCQSCGDEGRTLWSNERWKVTALHPTANPVGLFLETIGHVDFEHFNDELASELGLLTVRLEAAIRSLDSVGRVHIHRWGDGSSHFHFWFQGRPARQLELYGWGNVLWSQILDPLPSETVDANHALVIGHLHTHFGGTIAEAPIQ